MDLKKILVIEDNKKHVEDAKEFFENIKDWQISYATNYEDAKKIIFERPTYGSIQDRGLKDIDGVISDIYFPLVNGSSRREEHKTSEAPIGVLMGTELEKAGIPFVLNTAGYHHGGPKYEWISLFSGYNGWTLIDVDTSETIYGGEAKSKDWAEAYERLKMRLEDSEY